MTSINEMDKYAKQWVREAGTKIRASFETKLNIETKTNANDLVTNIDKDTEKYFVKSNYKNLPRTSYIR